MNTNKNQIQQGDVLLRKVAQLPDGCKAMNTRTVALGEHTGHHHTFEEGVVVMEAPDKRIYVINQTDEPKKLIHQEHNPVIGMPGVVYEFGAVREKDWFQNMVRPVMD